MGSTPGMQGAVAPCIRKLKFSPFPTGEGGRGDGGKKFMMRQKYPATKAAIPPSPPKKTAKTTNGRKQPMKQVNIYTDGACRGNPGPGGWGAILVYGTTEKEMSGGERTTTNNRMELTAVIAALSALREPCTVTLTSDSQYVINGIEKGWAKAWRARGWRKADKSPALNADLWASLLDLLDVHTVTFVWVRGHAGHPYNERCDRLATAVADSLRTQE